MSTVDPSKPQNPVSCDPLPSGDRASERPVLTNFEVEGSETRPQGVKGHKLECLCLSCARIKKARAEGRPTKAEQREAARQRKLSRAAAKLAAKELRAKTRANEKEVKKALVAGAMAGQLSAGVVPSIEKAAEIAAVSVGRARAAVPADFVQSSLEKNGITLDLLDKVGLDGLAADAVKLVYDEKGNVVDSIAMPDHHARHKFWRDYNMMHGRLGEKESGGGGGGLIIIAPEDAKVVRGHPAACTCDECVAMWNEKTKHIASRAARAMAVDAEILDNDAPLPDLAQAESDEPTDDFSDLPDPD